MTNELVDRVARAILGDNSISCANDRCGCTGYERWECVLGKNPHGIARDAIEAMRELSEPMREAMRYYLGDGFNVDPQWNAAIDAALKGEG